MARKKKDVVVPVATEEVKALFGTLDALDAEIAAVEGVARKELAAVVAAARKESKAALTEQTEALNDARAETLRALHGAGLRSVVRGGVEYRIRNTRGGWVMKPRNATSAVTID
jgi:hypothetical protein